MNRSGKTPTILWYKKTCYEELDFCLTFLSRFLCTFAVDGPLVGCLTMVTYFSHHFLPILLSKIPSALFTDNSTLFLPPEHHYPGDIVGCLKDSLRFSQHFFEKLPFICRQRALCWLSGFDNMFQPSLFTNSVVQNTFC